MNYVDYYLHYKKLFVGSRGWEPAQRCITLKQGGGEGGELGKRQEPRAWENIKMLDTDL